MLTEYSEIIIVRNHGRWEAQYLHRNGYVVKVKRLQDNRSVVVIAY